MRGKNDWRLYLALIVVGALVVVLLNTTGVLEEQREKLVQQQQEHPLPQPGEVFSEIPTEHIVLTALIALIWVGGANVLIVRQRRKAGLSWWACFNPFMLPFRYFDRKAWAILAVLLLCTVFIAQAAVQFLSPG